MLFARLSDDTKWILVEGNPDEVQLVRSQFVKKINSWYIIKKKNKNANVDETFMNQYGILPTGLWVELINACKKFNVSLVFEDDFTKKTTNCHISREEYDSFMDNLFENSEIKPKKYQLDSVYNMVYYKNCCVEISTSGGKTLISYMLFKFLKDYLGVKRILFITPKTELTTQSAEKYVKYDNQNHIENNWKYEVVHSKAKKKDSYEEYDIVFGNYQSIRNKKEDFFKIFDAVILDEAHHGQCSSCRTIMKKCTNAQYKIGMTGTFPEADSYNNFVLQSNIGPVVYRYSSYELINEEKFATNVVISMIGLKYLDPERLKVLHDLRKLDKTETPETGGKILKGEQRLARENQSRFLYICKAISKTTKNSLVIFSDIKHGYGRKVYNYIKENTSKRVFYIDGEITSKVRSEIIDETEKDTSGNTIIVASMQCFSEGIDIGNLWNIFLIETTKAETTVAQILGRGMRRFEGKDKTMMIDFVDDFRFGGDEKDENYLWKHGMERYSIYKRRGFPCSLYSVDLNQNK